MDLIVEFISFMSLLFAVSVVYIGIENNFKISFTEAIKRTMSIPMRVIKKIKGKLTPSTDLEKEIKAEKKEILRLEKLKIDIDELEQLRERRKRLFAEVDEGNVEVNKEKQMNIIEKSCERFLNRIDRDIELEELRRNIERNYERSDRNLEKMSSDFNDELIRVQRKIRMKE